MILSVGGARLRPVLYSIHHPFGRRPGNNSPPPAGMTFGRGRGRPTALCTEYRLLGLTQAEFNRLVVEHGDVLYRMAYRLMGDAHDAEDVVQDTFRSVWKSRERFEHGRGDRAWLTSILRRRSA